MDSVLLDAAGRRRSPAHHAGPPPRAATAQQRPALPGRPAERRRDRRDHGLRGRPARRPSPPGPDRRALARGPAHQRSTGAHRERPGPDARSDPHPPRQGGKRREVGMDPWAWDQLQPWLARRQTLPVGALFCVVYGPTRGRAQLQRCASSCAAPPPKPEYDAGSLPISSAMPTPSRWPTKACRWSSSSASSATPTSASPRSTFRASTTPRSSTPSAPDTHP
jgi:hypothetical protein